MNNNQFNIDPDQLRQLQNLIALAGTNLGLLGSNIINPNLLNPLLANAVQPNNSSGGLGSSGAPTPAGGASSNNQASNLFTMQLQQHLQQIVLQSRRQQPSLPSDPPVSIRQQQASQNSSPMLHQQKRKRGRPPLSGPSTSNAAADTTVGSSSGTFDLNYLNMIAAFKNQQDQRERVQREKLMQERQRELKMREDIKQRELKLAQERAERNRIQADRERQRAEMERQRKAQHRMALQDIDRERRRQHMIMVRNLDGYKRNEEREKNMTAIAEERKTQQEKRTYQKRLEVELTREIRKSVDDMMLKNHKQLATLNRIPGLKLPGKAFADLLMSFEFLKNFGETVGLDAQDIPNINTFQLGLLNLNTWAEDQFISILHHLCMFAVKDQRFPYAGSLKEIETLEKTNEGLSQLLHFYLQVMTLNAKTEMEHESRLYNLIEEKYFLSLNATQKAEMLAFICNELLCSQTVTKQMEETIENVAKLRKDKWVLENELRKYRAIKTKREHKEELEEAKKAASLISAANASNGDVKSEDDKDVKDSDKFGVKQQGDEKPISKTNFTNGSSSLPDNERDNEDTSIQPNSSIDFDDLEPSMTNDELNKKIENLTRQYNKTGNKLEKAINSMRANPLGQDRFRRRYWVLPQVGGVFVEGIESSEPEELDNNKFTEEELQEYEKEQQALNELMSINNNNSEESPDNESDKLQIKKAKTDDDMDKDEEDMMEVKQESENQPGVANMKDELVENGDSVNNEVTCEGVASVPLPTITWFSILPRHSCNFNKTTEMECEPSEVEDAQVKKSPEQVNIEARTNELSDDELLAMRHELCPVLAARLDELHAEQFEVPRKIHPQYQYGWWRITDAQQLSSISNVLHDRGSRERVLQKHLIKHFQYAANSCKNGTVDFEITSYDRQLAGKNYGAPVPHADDDSADDLKDGDEEDEEEDGGTQDLDEDTADDKAIQQAAAPVKKSKRKKGSRSARSRRLRARAAARAKLENMRNKVTPK